MRRARVLDQHPFTPDLDSVLRQWQAQHVAPG
jgi:hypothetical protein